MVRRKRLTVAVVYVAYDNVTNNGLSNCSSIVRGSGILMSISERNETQLCKQSTGRQAGVAGSQLGTRVNLLQTVMLFTFYLSWKILTASTIF